MVPVDCSIPKNKSIRLKVVVCQCAFKILNEMYCVGCRQLQIKCKKEDVEHTTKIHKRGILVARAVAL